MKKMILCGLALATAASVSAQEITMYRTHNPNSPVSVTAVTTTKSTMVPQHINTRFVTAYPEVTVIAWEPVDTWWKASFMDDNRITYVFYNDAGLDYHVALPVLHNSVPEEVVSEAIRKYGPVLYGLSTMKAANGNLVYQVHLIENGVSRMTWMDASGTEMTNVFRDKDDDEEDDSMTMNQ